jgi:hypothetical protein
VGTCDTCFATAFASATVPLSQQQINALVALIVPGANNINQLCNVIDAVGISAVTLHAVLDVPLGATNVNLLIQCLQLAGVTVIVT